ncbi:hypothetical protein Q0Z83_022310 [Actinoplanes sichuanensis]|nr:hypothetical protein Q0Z83_022310 [Actinoplanes sichuanensis]
MIVVLVAGALCAGGDADAAAGGVTATAVNTSTMPPMGKILNVLPRLDQRPEVPVTLQAR